LFLGWHPVKPIFSVNTFTGYTSSDFNGFRPNPGTADSFIWTGPAAGILVDYAGARETRKFGTLAEYCKSTGQDRHSIVVDYGIFVNVTKPDPNDITKLYKFVDLDFRLRPEARAVDAGMILANVNDGFTGKAPDLGALEVGQQMPVYGPRP
jgi:hypothetical protein